MRRMLVVDMTPEAIALRLREVAGLHRLGQSIRKARRAGCAASLPVAQEPASVPEKTLRAEPSLESPILPR